MEWLLYNDETGMFRSMDEIDMLCFRSTFEEPSDDNDYLAELDELERQGWSEVTPLKLAMILGDVHDEASLWQWHAGQFVKGSTSPYPDSPDDPMLVDDAGHAMSLLGAGVLPPPAQAVAVPENGTISKGTIPKGPMGPTISPPTIDPAVLYTASEAAQRLRCGKTNIYDLWNSGGLSVTRTGAGKGGLRVTGADLLRFLQSRTTGGPAPKVRYKHLRSMD